MSFLILVLILSGLGIIFDLAVFEWLFCVILGTPILAHVAGVAGFPLNKLTYLACLIFLAVVIILISRKTSLNRPTPKYFWMESSPILVFCGTFLFTHSLCLLWPDFVDIGERLRDYALLASNINSPLEAREPWMVGANLNYYLYWYRFGHFISKLLPLEVWNTYHFMSAFSISFFVAGCYRLMNRYLGISIPASLCLSLVIGFGSNVAGIIDFLKSSDSWWGPSRVIKGAINEFPAWSFVLGDIHPHYLNLGLAPFFLSCFLISLKGLTEPAKIVPNTHNNQAIFSAQSTFQRHWLQLSVLTLVFFAFCLTTTLWMYNSNAWEVPIWAGTLGGLVILYFFWLFLNRKERTLFPLEFPSGHLITAFFLLCIFSFSLYHSSRNIVPAKYPWTFVHAPVLQTTRDEILLHWGLPLTLIALGLIFCWQKWAWRTISAFIIFISLTFSKAWVFLAAILLLSGIRAIADIRKPKASQGPAPFDLFLAYALGISALVFILVPEFVYLDDPYGGDSERMNTIFKVCSATWFMLHIYAFYLAKGFAPKIAEWTKQVIPLPIILSALAILIYGFFIHTTTLRKNEPFTVQPFREGLSTADRRFPGAAEIIKSLVKAPRGTILEAQGNPYSWTSFISTLSGQESFLGWANHVELLTQQYDEVRRRAQITESIYSGQDCKTTENLLKRENIRYVVVGQLERMKYPKLSDENFTCLTPFAQANGYRVFETP